MKKKRKITSSGSVEEFSVTTRNTSDPNAYSSLLEFSKEECPICYRIFRNRYKAIIHTMTHITIPLLKDSLKQCQECKLYFPSQEDLLDHISKKHVKVSEKRENGKKDMPVVKDEVILESNEWEPILFEDSEPDLSDDLKELKPFTNGFYDSLHDVKKIVIGNGKIDVIGNRKVDIKSRIFFEDDEILSSLDSPFYQENMDREELYEQQTIHYNDLKETTKVACEYCHKIFFNRYDLIVHHTYHLHLKPTSKLYLCPICERFSTKTKARHIFEKHRQYFTARIVQKQKKICHKCNFPYYDYDKHKSSSHHVFRPKLQRKSAPLPRNSGPKSAVFKFCELCYVRSRFRMIVVRNISEITPQNCKKCHQVFFEGKLVRGTLNKMTDRKRFDRNLKQFTNEDRLKNIQHRLKILKKIK